MLRNLSTQYLYYLQTHLDCSSYSDLSSNKQIIPVLENLNLGVI
jgi:hypothetical protein